jgi:phage/plasmid-like protein (TIGR03299 family)
MSHELDFSKGIAAIAIADGTDMPWHGYVNEYLQPNDSPEEIVRKSGLDFTVKKADIVYEAELDSGTKIKKEADNRCVIYRADDGAFLSTMSKSNYVPAQPLDLVRGLVELTRNKGFVIDCVMALKDGKVISALARREADPGQVDKKGKDLILPYCGLLTSFDGTLARSGSLTSVRRVCMNTVRFSLESESTITTKQRNTKEFTLEQANTLFDKLALFDESFAKHLLELREMTKVKVTEEMVTRFFAKLYSPEAFTDVNQWDKCPINMNDEKVSTNKRNTVADLLNAFYDGPGSSLETADGTLYGAVQAVTFFQDHEARTKGDKRWESTFIGNGARVKDNAYELARDIISNDTLIPMPVAA